MCFPLCPRLNKYTPTETIQQNFQAVVFKDIHHFFHFPLRSTCIKIQEMSENVNKNYFPTGKIPAGDAIK